MNGKAEDYSYVSHTMTDPIADMLTRIRNAQAVRKTEVVLPFSKLKIGIAMVMKREGYIEDVEAIEWEGRKMIRIVLRYVSGKGKIMGIKRISKPGRRVYAGYKEVKIVLNDLGFAIVSTPKGLLTNREIKQEKVGGEVLCEIY